MRTAIDQLVGPRPAAVPPDQALATIGIDLGQVRSRLEATFGPDAMADHPPPYTPLAREALQGAVAEASQLGQAHVGTEHELLGLAQVTEGLAAKVLEHLGVDPALVEELRERAAATRGTEVADQVVVGPGLGGEAGVVPPGRTRAGCWGGSRAARG